MDCFEVQERIFEGFEGELSSEKKKQLDRHLSACPACAQFFALQSRLDVRLREEITPPRLSASFRVSLQERKSHLRREPWPDWLPDFAHLAGSAVAIGVSAVLLPLPVPVVVGTGVVVALAAYSLQTMLVGTFEQWTE